jgi:N-acetyl-gamma-glutamyl-phosphate reductase
MPKINVLIAGSTGYIGIQLVKLLIKHPNVKIKYLCGKSSVGKNISKFDNSLKKKKLPKIVKFNQKYLNDVDVVFTSLPNGEAQIISKNLLKKNLLIDLSADFRLQSSKI